MSDVISGAGAHAAWLTGKQMGRDEELKRVLGVIADRICFDHRANGTCEHGQCWALHDLRAKLQGVELSDE